MQRHILDLSVEEAISGVPITLYSGLKKHTQKLTAV